MTKLVEQEKLFEDIIKRVDNEEKVLVEFTSLGWDDGYLDKGMRAYIVATEDEQIYDSEDRPEEKVLNFYFDFSDFALFNKKAEKKIKFNNGDYGTMSEMGYVPEDLMEDFYLGLNYEKMPFKLITPKNNSIRKRYEHSKSKLIYTDWLELQLRKTM